MTKSNNLYKTEAQTEKCFLIGVELKGRPTLFSLDDSLAELTQLCQTAGLEVVGSATQKLDAVHPDTLIGKGKLEELVAWRRELDYDVLVVDEELQPRQQRALEDTLEVKVLDRTALILDIFAQHAHTREGQLQVELAQYEYRLPRLTRMWTHLARQAGSGGRTRAGVGLRGPGEMQLEMDRREIRARISRLKIELDHVRTHRQHYRQKREQTNTPVIAVVGYTNAGKSTLLNTLANANALAEDKLFATLDPTTRRVQLPSGHEVLFTDTVGFIQKLPTQLIAAFRATLEEITEADVLLHVLDATHRNVLNQYQAVMAILEELDANHKPVITALNKIDQYAGDPERLLEGFPSAICISAKTGTGLSNLLAEAETTLEEEWPLVSVLLPFSAGKLVSVFHERGSVDAEEFLPAGTEIHGRLPPYLLEQFQRYIRP